MQPPLDDIEIDPLRPEILEYCPGCNGRHELVALEYVVLASTWGAADEPPQQLFAQPFDLVRSPNRDGAPMPFHGLHVRACEHNPNGLFNDWNLTFARR